ncbi:hypothetical protein ACS0TY_033811 [Phlomoides rotata]
MGLPTSDTSSTTPTTTRLKRESYRRTKHDSSFSQWKILIGAFDWEDHSIGKEGAEKYRTQNLPNWTCCPGVYELGIATSRRETRKLDSSSVVPVYIGQAENLRTRLQQYGRDGNHLENGCSNNKGPRLFADIFSRRLPIVYRCAPMKSKKDAEITEKQLLDKFDYAWNKGFNGARRKDDIFKILDRREKASLFSHLTKKVLFSNRKEVGIKITTASNSSVVDNNTIFSRILGIKRLQPKQEQCSSGDYCNDICGVSIGHGSVCSAPPVSGRKRCAVHKGLRVNGNISRFLRPNGERTDQHCCDSQDENLRRDPCDEKFTPTCGFILNNDSPCTRKPLRGNKRCLEHKGRRIHKSSISLQGKM